MIPRMSPAEVDLFKSFVSCSDRYLEFGSGGSTYAAGSLVRHSVVAIDSSKEWLDRVREKCLEDKLPVQPTLVHVDIGPTGAWGHPMDKSTVDRWPLYHSQIWSDRVLSDADLYMVDGRFRVACFLQILLHCKLDSVIMFHDFAPRSEYHVVKEIAREIAVVEGLSIFLPQGDMRGRIADLIQETAYVPL
jgi:hypothetical protein